VVRFVNANPFRWRFDCDHANLTTLSGKPLSPPPVVKRGSRFFFSNSQRMSDRRDLHLH